MRALDNPYVSVEGDFTVDPPVERTVIRAQRMVAGSVLDEVIAAGPWSEWVDPYGPPDANGTRKYIGRQGRPQKYVKAELDSTTEAANEAEFNIRVFVGAMPDETTIEAIQRRLTDLQKRLDEYKGIATWLEENMEPHVGKVEARRMRLILESRTGWEPRPNAGKLPTTQPSTTEIEG